jgi:toxin HigB-1
MIRSFKCRETEKIFLRAGSRRFKAIEQLVLRKLMQIEASDRVEDLRVPPGNRLERLFGDRHGQWSIRVNDQWRICFGWHDGAAWNVEIVDYH